MKNFIFSVVTSVFAFSLTSCGSSVVDNQSSAKISKSSVQKVDIKLPQGVKFIEKGRVIEGSPELYKFELANGLRVLLLSDERNPVAQFYMQLDAGSNREILGKTGLAHFFEHMMF